MIKSKSVRTIAFLIFSSVIFISVFCLVLSINKPVTIIVNGVEISTRTNGNMTEDISSGNGIVLEDGGIVFPFRYSQINSGETTVLYNPVPVILYLGDRDPYEVMTTSKTVEDLLREHEIEYEEEDIVLPSLYANIVPDLEIRVKYVDVEIETVQYEVEYNTSFVYNEDMYEGTQSILQRGKNGIRLVEIERQYENGVEVGNSIIYDVIEVDPIDEIVEKGTKIRESVYIGNDNSIALFNNAYENGSRISFLGKEYSISYVKYVEVTAFYNSGSNGNHTTATGNPTVYNPSGWSTIAVDPKVIPLGTRVYVDGYGFGIAHDTGSAIKGDIIDVFMPSRSEAYAWGRKKNVKIYILN